MNDEHQLNKLHSGREIAHFAEEHGAEVHKKGSHLEIVTERGRVYVTDSARDMKRPDRESAISRLKALLLVAVGIGLAALFIYVNYGGF